MINFWSLISRDKHKTKGNPINPLRLTKPLATPFAILIAAVPPQTIIEISESHNKSKHI